LKIKYLKDHKEGKFEENLHVIHELCRDQYTGNEQAMNIERIDGQRGLPLRESVEINVGNDEARRATIGVLEDPFEVALDGDGGPGEAVEDGDLLRLELACEVVGLCHALEKRGQEGYDLGHHLRALKLSHCCRPQFLCVAVGGRFG
jgi:hypothetical protein